jgi:7 transmembrane helices usually fused to an inactive transglutaminase/Transglutaminase-like superfamily
MSRTGWSLVVAGALVAISVGLAAGRRYVLGPEVDGSAPSGTWRVTLVTTGELAPQDNAVTIGLAPDFRNQHVLDERFASRDLTVPRAGKDKDPRPRLEATFRRTKPAGAQSFRIDYSLHVRTGVRQPTPSMLAMTAELDAAPSGAADLQASPRIESTCAEVRDSSDTLVRDLLEQGKSDEMAIVSALYTFVAKIPTEPARSTPITARGCLKERRGDSGGKARLLVALCRSRGIPARLVSGLVRAAGQEQPLHYWAEAWVNQQWLPMCPTRQHFDRPHMRGYLVLHVGDDDFVRCRTPVEMGFIVHAPPRRDPGEVDEDSTIHRFWQKMSLMGLGRGERKLVAFLLLLPLAALIVSFVRTVVGVPTFGTFSPALLGLAFLQLETLHWGLAIFVLIVLVGWGMRHLLEGFHLLQVPRTSALLTLIVMLLIAVVVVASHANIAATHYISLFPLVILTHLVERFWTVEAEDGTASSFKTLVGTMAVATMVSISLAPDAVSEWMFRYPETLGLVLAAQFLLGRYTGYRLTELYRFGDLLEEEPAASHHSASSNGAATTNGSSARADDATVLVPAKREETR